MRNYKKRIFTPLIAVASLLCLAMAWLFVAMYQLVYYAEQKDLVDQLRYDIVALERVLMQAESGERAYLLSQNTAYLAPVVQARKQALGLLARFKQDFSVLTTSNATFEQLNRMVQQKLSAMDDFSQVQHPFRPPSAQWLFSHMADQSLMQNIQTLLQNVDTQLLSLRAAHEQRIRQRMFATIIGAVSTVLLIIGLLLFSYRSTTLLIEQVFKNKAEAAQLSHHAEHDLLTGLPNRRSIDLHFDQVHQYASNHSRPYALFFMDLDGFKVVNDAHGHEFGDALLVEVTGLFKKVLRQTDFLARQGGDEFLLLVTQYMHRAELILLAQRLIQLFNQPVRVHQMDVKIGVSIGIAEYPYHGRDVKQLLFAADHAMYLSKRNGKNRYSFAMQLEAS